ncbi:MAG: prepilin-type N-terminal cleavage/methylation domain-containing protein [Armatimonadota bacterium]
MKLAAKRQKNIRPVTKARQIAGLRRFGETNRGFTLVEVLVVLSILVLLFALLFAPMMIGLDMAADARSQTKMQDSVRMAMEQARRELSNAVYVYPNPTVLLAGDDETLGTADDRVVTDYSQIIMVPAARDDDSGQLLTPLQPRTYADGTLRATRFLVKLVDPTQPYGIDNPFALYRQEGMYLWDPVEAEYVFGSEDSTGTFQAGVPDVQNVMTAVRGTDIPATSTVCTACGAQTIGYVSQCPADCGATSDQLHYLHRDVRFGPERITGETLDASEHNTLYTAQHGNWVGLGDSQDGNLILSASALSNLRTQLQPRIRAYRYDGAAGAYDDLALDSATATRSDINLRLQPRRGNIRIGAWEFVKITVDPGDLGSGGLAANAMEFYDLTVTDVPDQAGQTETSDSWDSSGSGTRTTSVEPIYPSAPESWQDPKMPVAYGIYPEHVDGTSSDKPAKIVPGSLHVRMVYTPSGTSQRYRDFTSTDVADQEDIGRLQYSLYMATDQTGAELRFNRWYPPTPEMFRNNAGVVDLDSFEIYIWYYYRRNFDPATAQDDIIVADYSTNEIINVNITLSQYEDPVPYTPGTQARIVPSDVSVPKVTMHDQIEVRNIGR